jgi:hypothetical protein
MGFNITCNMVRRSKKFHAKKCQLGKYNIMSLILVVFIQIFFTLHRLTLIIEF